MTISSTERKTASMRFTALCPCCGSKCKTSTSKAITNKLRLASVECMNAVCGWTGVASIEIIRTVSPPSALYQGNEPPMMTRQDIEEFSGTEQRKLLY